jgi:hypothetical protein
MLEVQEMITAYFALAIDSSENPNLGKPGVDGVCANIAEIKIPSSNSKGVVNIPIHAMRCTTKAEFVDKVSKIAVALYDEGLRSQKKD